MCTLVSAGGGAVGSVVLTWLRRSHPYRLSSQPNRQRIIVTKRLPRGHPTWDRYLRFGLPIKDRRLTGEARTRVLRATSGRSVPERRSKRGSGAFQTLLTGADCSTVAEWCTRRRGQSHPGVMRGLTLETFARVWKEEDCGEDLQPGHDNEPHVASGEGQEGRLRQRRHPPRRRALGALLARHGQRRVPHGGANRRRHRNRETSP